MEFLYIANLIAAFLLMLTPVWFSTRYVRLPLINPFTLLFLIGFPVELMKVYIGPMMLLSLGLFDEGYQFALLMGNLFLLMQLISLIFFYQLFGAMQIEKIVPFRHRLMSSKDLYRGKLLFLSIFFLSFYLLASAEYGLVNWLSNPRIGYQLFRSGQGHLYAIAISAMSVAMVLACLANPTPMSLLRVLIVYLAFGYLLGSKGLLLNIFSTSLVFLWFVRWRYLNYLLIIGGFSVFTLMAWNLSLSSSDTFELQSIITYFDYYKNAADYYREYLSGQLSLFYGDIAITSLWAYVPRFIWPDKPFAYGIVLVNEIFWPGQAELTNTPAFGGAVEQFADFGFIGVLAYGFFSLQTISIALMSHLLYRRPGVDIKSITLLSVALMVIQFSPGFGVFFPGILYAVLLATTIFFINLVRRRRRRLSRHDLHAGEDDPHSGIGV